MCAYVVRMWQESHTHLLRQTSAREEQLHLSEVLAEALPDAEPEAEQIGLIHIHM